MVLNNIGIVKKDQGDFLEAEEYFRRSFEVYQEIGDQNDIAKVLGDTGIHFIKKGTPEKALSLCEKNLVVAKEIGSVALQKTACECLYGAYKDLGEDKKALMYYEQKSILEDSLQSVNISEKLQQMEFENQMLKDSIDIADKERLVEEAHGEEIRRETKTRNIAFLSGGVFLVLAAGLFSRIRYVRISRAALQVEKDRSENLLLNILPAEIPEELKQKGRADARDFELVSILFTDFIGFTEQSARLSANDLVEEINHCFETFDGIMEKYGIEKIKTIGDFYLAAGGLPIPTDGSGKDTVMAALDMQDFITNRKAENDALDKIAFEMRAGIHTAPVVAGIVGVKKFQYDIWGDTVNTASRMESNGEAGKVNISAATYELLKNNPKFSFNNRGNISVKGKGEMEMYFVDLKTEKDLSP